MNTTYTWYEVYRAALLETDWTRMEERIRAAESALKDRKNQMASDHGGSPEENQALADAMRSLSILRGEAASWAIQRSKEAS